jgi:tripartite-type tricarboxylate transporter receptor subunit TctC
MTRPAKLLLIAVVLALTSAPGDRASAQAFPSKPIRIVVGFAPGGPADVMARLIGQRLTAVLGQSVVIDNRPGASGAIAARAVAESEADGYTLLLGNTSTLIIAPMMYRNVNYDPDKSFAPVALLGTTANLLLVYPGLPAKSVAELIALARARPGKLNYASPGIGTPPHLIGEMFKQRAGIDVAHVPYRGGGLSLQATVAGETQYSFESPTSSLPLIEAGSIRVIAVSDVARIARLPDVPTMVEAGMPDFAFVSFTGVVAPAGTPPAVVNRLNNAVNEGLQARELAGTLANLGVEMKIFSPNAFATFLGEEREKWAAVVKTAGVRVE